MSGFVRIRARSPDPYVPRTECGPRYPFVLRRMPSFADVTVHVVDDVDGHETSLHNVKAVAFEAHDGAEPLTVLLRLYDVDLDVEARALLHDDELAVCLEALIEAAESATLALPQGRAAELIGAAKRALERRTLDKVPREGVSREAEAGGRR